MGRLADGRRRRFLLLAVLAGPIGMLGLYAASHFGLRVPQPSLAGWTLVNALFLAPVLEELVFRGGLQEVLDRTAFGQRNLVGGVSVGNVVTSVVFSAVHLMAAPTWLAAGIFLPSLVFGRLKQLYPSLLPAMLVHGWYNACYLCADPSWRPMI